MSGKKRFTLFTLFMLLCMLLCCACGIITYTPPQPTPEPAAELTPQLPLQPTPEPPRFTVEFDPAEVFPDEAARQAAEILDPAIRQAVALLNSMKEEDRYVVLERDYTSEPLARDSLTDPLALEIYDTVLEAARQYGDYYYYELDYGEGFFSSYATAFDALKLDHRDLFLSFDGSFSGYDYTPGYFMPGDWLDEMCEDREAVRAAAEVFPRAVDRIFEKMPVGLSNYQKCCYFAFVIAAATEYDDDFETLADPFQEYNTLLEGIAVCQGYARSLAWLCRRAGIDCTYCSGTVEFGEAEHAWNRIGTETGSVYMDVTWFDRDGLEEDWRAGAREHLFMLPEDLEFYGYAVEWER